MASSFCVDVVVLDLGGFVIVLFMAKSTKMRGLLRMQVGVRALPSGSMTLSRSSLWFAVTRPTLLQSRAWKMEKIALQLSYILGRSGGSRPYSRKR